MLYSIIAIYFRNILTISNKKIYPLHVNFPFFQEKSLFFAENRGFCRLYCLLGHKRELIITEVHIEGISVLNTHPATSLSTLHDSSYPESCKTH